MADDETRGFQCTNRTGSTCVLIASTEMDADVIVPTGSCQGTRIQVGATATFPDPVDQIVTASGDPTAVETIQAVHEVTHLVPMIQFNYRFSDLLATDTSTEGSTSETVATTTSQSTLASTTPSQDAAENYPSAADSGMSTARIATIVGAAVGGLLVLGVAAWLLWRWNKRRQNQARVNGAVNSSDAHPQQYTEYQYQYTKHDNVDAYGVAKPVEMAAYSRPQSLVELAGDYGHGPAGTEIGAGYKPRKGDQR